MGTKQSNEMATLKKTMEDLMEMAGYAAGRYAAISEQLGKIEAKKKLKLPLTQKERAIWVLYGTEIKR